MHNYRHFFINVNISAKKHFAQLSTLFHKCRDICHGPTPIETSSQSCLPPSDFKKTIYVPLLQKLLCGARRQSPWYLTNAQAGRHPGQKAGIFIHGQRPWLSAAGVRQKRGSWDPRHGVGGVVSGINDVAGEPDGQLGRGGGVGWLERVIPLCPTSPPYNLTLLF